MEHLAERLDRAADTLAAVDRRMPSRAVGADAFAADDSGVPGRLGRQLHARWAAVLDSRAQEAGRLAARLADAANAVRSTARDYSETDEAAGRRLAREM
ncbi:hypothetical protein GCM10010172_00690 [Paractinoplanes ferrugineus]|uniref:Excreted virulence factor EspC (Type VII ESX diderm) n=1 Tax=Paractinoplanes ferrugineus TaxID=113564 RepID=A0A919J347_9ACTN|nr:type VII secretion target [Actinoplanes ferrugineus]GIE13916.1 hypothetical protein Afe05nite_57560 [Actinoplanes ferrugineus]